MATALEESILAPVEYGTMTVQSLISMCFVDYMPCVCFSVNPSSPLNYMYIKTVDAEIDVQKIGQLQVNSRTCIISNHIRGTLKLVMFHYNVRRHKKNKYIHNYDPKCIFKWAYRA